MELALAAWFSDPLHLDLFPSHFGVALADSDRLAGNLLIVHHDGHRSDARPRRVSAFSAAFHPLRTLGRRGTLSGMKLIPLAFGPAILCSCSGHSDPHERIMDQIERQVSLPSGAHRLRDYARYYAYDDKGRVFAVYELPGPPSSGGETCNDMDGAIPPERWRTVPCPKQSPEQAYLPAGQRRWMSSELSIPMAPDTIGCEQIDFTYDARRGAFATTPSCPSEEYQLGSKQ